MACPSSHEFHTANHLMHKGMAINFTCDAEVDFVQGMIPHHQGAIDMCGVLMKAPTAADDYLTELCQNITRTQKQEIMYMTEWLKKGAHSRGASCDGTAYPTGEVCEDLLLLSDTCHHFGGDFACRCEHLIEEHQCGTSSTLQGSSFDVTSLCMRSCGACKDAEQGHNKTAHSKHGEDNASPPEDTGDQSIVSSNTYKATLPANSWLWFQCVLFFLASRLAVL